MVFGLAGCNNKDKIQDERKVLDTYKIIDSLYEFVEKHIYHTYYKMSNETWKTDEISYSSKDSIFVYLSNIKKISFEQAYLASGISSNTNDYFDVKEDISRHILNKIQ